LPLVHTNSNPQANLELGEGGADLEDGELENGDADQEEHNRGGLNENDTELLA